MKGRINKKKKLGSYPYLTVVFTISLSLTVIGLFSAIILHAQSLTTYIKQNIELHIYLNSNVSDNELVRVESLIASKPYVHRKNGEVEIAYISREQAVNEFINETGEDFTDVLGINPLKASLIIKIDPQFSDIKQLQSIKSEIESISGIYEVDFNARKEKEVNAINRNMEKILFFLGLFTAIAIITIILLINNTIKIALFSQRFLIRSMQLVGARPSFIQWPFIKTALFQGLCSGLIAALLISNILQYVYSDVAELREIANHLWVLMLLASLPVLGLMISTLSTFIVIKKYLKLSLDELY